MSDWEETLRALEFDRLLEHLEPYALSEPGAAELRACRPFADANALRREQALVSEMRRVLDFDDPFPIDAFTDIRPHLRKASIEDNLLSPKELVEVSSTATLAANLRKYFRGKLDRYPALAELIEPVASFAWLHKEIIYAIDPKTFEVLDRASSDLARVRKQIVSTQEHARRRMEALQRELARQGLLQEDLVTLRDGRLVLMVKEEHRNKVPGLIHGHSASGQSYFIEPVEAFELNNRVQELRVQEQREVERILRRLTALVRGELPGLEQNFRVLVTLDRLHAKARFSQDLQATEPVFNTHGRVRLLQGRHPLLLLRWKDPKRVVPLDLDLGENFTTLVVTGPNAGGKTVALKTVGLLTVMALSGLHITATMGSEIALVDQVFADIGDEQSVEMDLSTFSSRVRKLKSILDEATAESLVLVDEIGTGTDPEEGAALAMAILEELTKRGTRTMVTTHHGALKAFAHETPGVENGSMEFDAETLQPTYRFRSGVPGSSYAFEIAERLGLPERLIRRAREFVGEEKHRLERLIVDLERRVQDLDERSRKLSIRESELEGLVKLYRQRVEELKREEKARKKQALEEADEILRRANALVEKTIREIRETQAEREAVRAARAELEKERQRTEELLRTFRKDEQVQQPQTPRPVAVGEEVVWKKFGTEGRVLDEPDEDGRVLLEAGSVKMRVPVAELEVKPGGKKRRRRGGSRYALETAPNVRGELDIRGLTVEEALEQVDRYLDAAVLAGFEQVRIIHGKGTGRLREQIRRYLQKDPRVRSYRLGTWEEGDIGVTIVELKP